MKKLSEIKMTRQLVGILLIALVVLVIGGAYFFSNYEIMKTSSVADGTSVVFKEDAALNLAVVKKAKNLTGEEAAQKAIDFANQNMLTDGSKAEFVSVKEASGLYTFKLKVDGQEYESYVTKDGKMFFVQGIAIDGSQKTSEDATPQNTEVVKSDRPDIKVFVMTYCPYGLQAQKMFLPVYDLLKDKADMGIYFVNYAMHGKAEVDENLRQYCIEKEQKGKYAAYLKCFVNDTKYNSCTSGTCEADWVRCLAEAGIDTGVLSACIQSTDTQFKVTADFNDKTTWVSGQFPKFAVEDDLNTKYGVQGSPTIVINEAEASPSERTPEQFKALVCSAFNTAPEECSQTLSEEAPSTGFGSGTDSASTTGGCGN